MNFLRNIENGAINIKKMGIIKALLVMFLSILLEGLGQLPVEVLNLFSGRFEKVVPYIIFVFGVLVKLYVIIILFKWLSNKANDQKPKQQLNWMDFAYAALMIIAFRLLFDNSVTLWVSKISMPNFIKQSFEELPSSPIISIFSDIVVAPIYEEIVFRGILLKGMTKKINPTIALVASALLFALVHMNIPKGINAFFLGLVVGVIYLRTGSIYLSIFAHLVNNILAILVSPLFSLIGGKYAVEIHGMFLTVGVILLVIACSGHNHNKIKNKPGIYKQVIEI
ncbi:CPBP family intramembrane metalloprotease [Clostridium sp. CM027]|uniref:CPBP family intramembrane glutamic endopeptidase n=1 Tax=Clostridium sp. CM027 TaxID=2849865 RepID=UPI001C6F0EB6|nr:type II CAAX endopeptidase family protein [Clostridium sp. CM027]MBW9146181.1 CPBP family intramembrane metalloprotease [Clostridium sp. CM027]UVE39837.1 CPBP family intramembrane metalloprotease [Clostridium sp. CM027]